MSEKIRAIIDAVTDRVLSYRPVDIVAIRVLYEV